MKLIAAVLIAGLVPAAAMAQSSPSPNNSSGSGISPSVQSPTDMGAANGDVRGVPSRGRIGTTGSALAPEPMLNPPEPLVRGEPIPGDQHLRNASPASPGEGIQKEH